MILADFHIGLEFWSDDHRYRCTDVGSRVVVAIRVDEATIGSLNLETGVQSSRTLDSGEAEREGWFNGPPYAVLESVFDEFDLEGCSLEREGDTDRDR